MNSIDDFKLNKYSSNYNIEIAILIHDIDLTKYTTKLKAELNMPEYNENYRDTSIPVSKLTPPFLAPPAMNLFDYYQNELGYFYIPVLMPLINKSDPVEIQFTAPSTGNIENNSLVTKAYSERNYISLVIPRYIVMSFKDKIPKDTKFLIGIIGGKATIQNISIIGVYGYDLTV